MFVSFVHLSSIYWLCNICTWCLSCFIQLRYVWEFVAWKCGLKTFIITDCTSLFGFVSNISLSFHVIYNKCVNRHTHQLKEARWYIHTGMHRTNHPIFYSRLSIFCPAFLKSVSRLLWKAKTRSTSLSFYMHIIFYRYRPLFGQSCDLYIIQSLKHNSIKFKHLLRTYT